MKAAFEVLKKSRVLILKVIDGLTIEQLNKTPEGFNNNIAWNVAHLVVTQQLLCYKLSKLNCSVSDEMISNFGKGSAPNYIISEEEFNAFKKLFIELPNVLEEDYTKGIFNEFLEYTTSVDITLNTIEEAISFNNYHEGIHLGVILQLKKLV